MIYDSSRNGAFIERTYRKRLAEKAPEIPTDFLLRWIEVESRGVINAKSGQDERGPFQIHPDERTQLGLTDAEWAKLLDPKQTIDFAVYQGLRLVRSKIAMADSLLGSQKWPPHDYWALVKLQHGSPAIAYLAFKTGKVTSWQKLTEVVHGVKCPVKLKTLALTRTLPSSWYIASVVEKRG